MGGRRDVSVGERERAEHRRPSSASRQSPSSDQTGAGILELQRTAGNRAAYRLATQAKLPHELTHALQHVPRLATAVQRDLDTTALQELVDLEKEPPVANKTNSGRAAALLKLNPSADEKNRIIAIRKVFAGGKAASPAAASTTSTTSPPPPTTTTTAPAPVPTPYAPDPGFLNTSQPIVGRIRVQVPTVDDRIIENIERLSQSTTVAGGSYYSTFFTEVDDLLIDVPAAAWATFSGATQNLAGLFKSLALPYKNDKSVGGYKGMASEILAALRTAALAEEPTVRIPKDYKPISSAFATTKDKTKNTKTAAATAPIATPAPKVMVQDVDRTDLFKVSGDKFYVEVKADSHTAVQKHHNYLVPQLKRYLEVIQTINDNYTQVLSKPDPLSAKEQKMKAKTDPRHRMPAIEITDPTGWLELFQPGGVRASAPSGGAAPAPPATRSTAAMYASNGFWLFIGGQRFSPAELGRIDRHVQAHIASINPTKFLAPAAFAAGATPDLAACY